MEALAQLINDDDLHSRDSTVGDDDLDKNPALGPLRQFRVVQPRWRNQDLTQTLRLIDWTISVHKCSRNWETGRVKMRAPPGNEPRARNLVPRKQDMEAPPEKHISVYSKTFLRSLEPQARRILNPKEGPCPNFGDPVSVSDRYASTWTPWTDTVIADPRFVYARHDGTHLIQVEVEL